VAKGAAAERAVLETLPVAGEDRLCGSLRLRPFFAGRQPRGSSAGCRRTRLLPVRAVLDRANSSDDDPPNRPLPHGEVDPIRHTTAVRGNARTGIDMEELIVFVFKKVCVGKSRSTLYRNRSNAMPFAMVWFLFLQVPSAPALLLRGSADSSTVIGFSFVVVIKESSFFIPVDP